MPPSTKFRLHHCLVVGVLLLFRGVFNLGAEGEEEEDVADNAHLKKAVVPVLVALVLAIVINY